MKKLKIVQVAPNVINLDENLTYGGIERVVIGLKREFDKLGQESYVLAPAGNNTIPDVISTLPESYWSSIQKNPEFGDASNAVFNNLAHIAKAIDCINEGDFDIAHDHTGKLFPFRKSLNKPLLTTLHGPSDWFWNPELYKGYFEGAFFSAVSQSQKQDYSFLNPKYVVPNGLNLQVFPFNAEPQDYFFSLGQITRHKGQHLAIKVSKDLGVKLIIGGNVSDDPTDPEDRIYFEQEIKPHLKGGVVEYVGELNDSQKKVYFKNAKAFLMPISCREAFGLVVIESLACGTPVVSFNMGAVPEIVQHSKNGYIATNLDEFRDYLSNINAINRETCRQSVLERFDIPIVAKKYLEVYEDIIQKSK